MKSARNADISPHSLRFNKERQRVNDCSNQTRTGSRLLSPINVRSYPFDRFSRGSGDGFPSEGEKKETPPPLFASSPLRFTAPVSRKVKGPLREQLRSLLKRLPDRTRGRASILRVVSSGVSRGERLLADESLERLAASIIPGARNAEFFRNKEE